MSDIKSAHIPPAALTGSMRDFRVPGGADLLGRTEGFFKWQNLRRQNGLWPKEVAGFDPDKEPRAFDRFCPIRNVTKDYPPTLLLHGDNDTDVPHQQSVDSSTLRELDIPTGVPGLFKSPQVKRTRTGRLRPPAHRRP